MRESGQEAVVKYAWIFTHGLAMLVNSGAFSSVSDIWLKKVQSMSGAFSLIIKPVYSHDFLDFVALPQ
jgi:hypothetical protein